MSRTRHCQVQIKRAIAACFDFFDMHPAPNRPIIFDCHGPETVYRLLTIEVRHVQPQSRMNRLTDHSKPLIFRAKPCDQDTHAHLVLDCQMPWLAGPQWQVLAHGASLDSWKDNGFIEAPGLIAGVLVGKGHQSLEAETCDLYRELFALTHGLNRYRIWNYVPQINTMVDGMENYVSFNYGRHQAFIEQFGKISSNDLSAASALGTQGGSLILAFVAGPDPVRHYENPLQTPASRYPVCYGKKSPLFARGSVVQAANGSTSWHLSGTASVRRAKTIGRDFTHQMNVTLENIDRMLDEMAVPTVRNAAWKVYLRDRRDLKACQERLAAAYPNEVAQMMFLEADICRRDLLLEIEAIFHQNPSC